MHIVGTIKIDDDKRHEHLLNNLRSMEPIAHLLDWRLNVVGQYAEFAAAAIRKRWPDAEITTDGESMAYPVMKAQLDGLAPDEMAFYWLEDHWYICQDTAAFVDVLREFGRSTAEVLTVSHLTCSWEQKSWLPIVSRTNQYTIYRVNQETQGRVWAHHPGAYAAGIPMICKARFASDMLECCRPELECSRKPSGFELPPDKARRFLAYRSWFEFIPPFHVFREVFRETRNPRAILWDEAMKIIEERKP